jgi:hypothetical protein
VIDGGEAAFLHLQLAQRVQDVVVGAGGQLHALQFVDDRGEPRERLSGRSRTLIREHAFNIARSTDTIKPFAHIL